METITSLLWIIAWSAGFFGIVGGLSWLAGCLLNWVGHKLERRMATDRRHANH